MIKTLSSVPSEKLQGKKVLVRVDFNVPLRDGKITDDKRIQAALPTIKYLLENNAAVILMSHLGRPKGKVVPELSLKIVYEYLQKLLPQNVYFAENFEEALQAKSSEIQAGEVLLLENLRFHPGEKNKDEAFAKRLASLADIYVNEAFGTMHRKDTSVYLVPTFFEEKYIGFLVEKELKNADRILKETPEKPFVLIIGGAKVSDKIGIIEQFIEKTDKILVGGAMAFTFLKSLGKEVGDSLVEEDYIDTAKEILQKAKEVNTEFLLPTDFVAAPSLKDYEGKIVKTSELKPGLTGLDIGEETAKKYALNIISSKTVLWNGPMGVFETEPFANGTLAVAKAVAQATEENGAFSLIGGGDSAAAVEKAGVQNKVSFVSTGGGALLTYLSGKELPALEVLKN